MINSPPIVPIFTARNTDLKQIGEDIQLFNMENNDDGNIQQQQSDIYIQQKCSSKYLNKPKIIVQQDSLPYEQKRKYAIAHKGFHPQWKKSALRIIYLITKFLITLKTKTDSYRFKLLNEFIFNIFNDLSSDYNAFYMKSLFRKKPNRLQKCIYNIKNSLFQLFQLKKFEYNLGVVMPDTWFRIVFDFTVLILIIINIFYIPTKLSFNLDQNQMGTFTIMLDTLPSIFFILEIIINFNTAYYSQGAIYTERKKIFKHYVKGDFFWDLLVCIPFIIHLLFEISYLDFFLLFRVTKVQKLFENIEQSTSIRDKFAAFIDLAKLIYFLVFVCHMCACIWHYIGVLEMQYLDNAESVWIVRYGMENQGAYSRYLYSFYWSTITTLTVGYGDIVPGNDIERLCVIIMILVTSIVFGYTISSIGSIFAQLKEQSDNQKNQMAIVRSFIKRRKLSPQLSMNIRKYFECYYQSEADQHNDQQVIGQLSQNLQGELKKEVFKKILIQSKLFQNSFTDSFINDLCKVIQIKKYSPGQEIQQINAPQQTLYFILKGEANAYINNTLGTNKHNFLRNYRKGNICGTKQFILQKESDFYIQANKFTEIAELDYQQFQSLLSKSDQNRQIFQQIKENLLYNQYYKKIPETCPICRFNHSLKQCHFTFYQVDLNKIQKLNIQEQNTRQQYNRKSDCLVKKIDFKNNRITIQDNSIQIGLDNGYYENIQRDDFVKIYGLFQEEQDTNKSNDDNDQNINSLKNVQITEKNRKSVQFSDPRRSTVIKKDLLNKNALYKCIEEEEENDSQQEWQQDHMKIIKNDFLNFLKSDQVQYFEKYQNYKFYFVSYNINEIIKKINQKSNDCLKLKRNLQTKQMAGSYQKISQSKSSKQIKQ